MNYVRTFGIAAAAITLLVLAGFFARWLSAIIGVSPALILLGLLIATSIALSAALSHWNRKLEESELLQLAARKKLDEIAVDEMRQALYARRSKVTFAIRVGFIWVNGPLLPLMLGPLALAQYALNIKSNLVSVLCLLGGFLSAWAWWSVNISLWRRWAERRQVDMRELQSRAEDASLVWPSGHFFERTEMDNVLKNRKVR